MNFSTLTRIAIRNILIQRGPHTCSDLVRELGLDPKRHKGTIHALMVDLENQGILGATRNDKTNKRDVWYIHTDQIRKRDRIAAAILG
jgi:predicted transcriptional regulator